MNEFDLALSTFYWRKRAEDYLRIKKEGPDTARAERLAKLAAAYSAEMDQVESAPGPAMGQLRRFLRPTTN
jgi:hypothetical protein